MHMSSTTELEMVTRILNSPPKDQLGTSLQSLVREKQALLRAMNLIFKNNKTANLVKYFSNPYHHFLLKYNYLKRSLNTSNRGNFFVSNIHPWKRRIIIELLYEEGAKSVTFIKNNTSLKGARKLLDNQKDPVVVFWGMGGSSGLQEYAEEQNIPIWRIEDGFVRSKGLGAHYVAPSSLLLDKSGGIYFNSTRASELEELISTSTFTDDDRKAAARYMDIILSKNITKYNLEEKNTTYNIDHDSDRNIIVFGQCEDDASIKYGSPKVKINTELIEISIRENPGANIYFRPHPDVTAGRRKAYSDIYEYSERITIMDQPFPIWENISAFAKVYVISSLAGFEAAMRGSNVRVVGMPFYAGWGITDDLLENPRRNKSLSIEELFFAAYIKAPHYLKSGTGKPEKFEKILENISK
ncbi:Capsule polysaccharide biosynthesis protein [Pseudovibrio sp. Ad13]|uniref:capsular polysaccharide export protein, LipB/KpsS family n=1 Tax=Pseudovibrio sp. Ad13 TaxID=989396 RepID=UPI0007B27703|nr:hypothetical protein [Pseudovibrio sp. Ad13]KZK75920.1 Capsule polysaccharide biosynthesis protein [Pseudovibrio sp. Ad13]